MRRSDALTKAESTANPHRSLATDPANKVIGYDPAADSSDSLSAFKATIARLGGIRMKASQGGSEQTSSERQRARHLQR